MVVVVEARAEEVVAAVEVAMAEEGEVEEVI